jgi:hypothetical protein
MSYVVLGLDMRFLGRKWQKKNGEKGKSNGFSHLDSRLAVLPAERGSLRGIACRKALR